MSEWGIKFRNYTKLLNLLLTKKIFDLFCKPLNWKYEQLWNNSIKRNLENLIYNGKE